MVADTNIHKEPSLKDLAYLIGEGDRSRAGRQYTRLAHAIRMLDDCRWWQFYRRRNIKRILVDTIKHMDD